MANDPSHLNLNAPTSGYLDSFPQTNADGGFPGGTDAVIVTRQGEWGVHPSHSIAIFLLLLFAVFEDTGLGESRLSGHAAAPIGKKATKIHPSSFVLQPLPNHEISLSHWRNVLCGRCQKYLKCRSNMATEVTTLRRTWICKPTPGTNLPGGSVGQACW